MNERRGNNTAVLVLSCDKYSDIWPVFFDFFDKYWSDCPYPVYLATNTLKYERKGVIQLFSNKHTTWSDELATILQQIKEKNVILILEDYFIYKHVNNNEIKTLIDLFENKNAAFCRLACFPKMYDELWPFKKFKDVVDYGEISPDVKYRVCLQTALWNKNDLSSLLKAEENPWQFEIEGSLRSNELNKPFLCLISNPDIKEVHGPITYYCTALSAGKWMRGAVKLCKENNIAINSNRPIESRLLTLKRYLYINSPIGVRKLFDFIQHKSKQIWK